MPIYAGTVKIKKRDNTAHVTVENIVVSGDDLKRNPENLKRALRYMKPYNNTPRTSEELNRWVIVEVIIIKQLSP
jgi:hypothetical protein